MNGCLIFEYIWPMDSRLGGGRSGASNSGQQVHYQLSLWISGSLILFYAHDHCLWVVFHGLLYMQIIGMIGREKVKALPFWSLAMPSIKQLYRLL